MAVTKPEVFPPGPLTVYFAAFVFSKELHTAGTSLCLQTVCFAVHGHNPLTMPEFWERAEELSKKEWNYTLHKAREDWKEVMREGTFSIHITR